MNEHNHPLSRFRRAVYAISALLMIALFVAVPAAFGILNIGWATTAVSFLLLMVLFMLNHRSEFVARLLQRLRLDLLIPAFKEVINHQKQLYQCRVIIRKMEYTLEFYRLWEFAKSDILQAETGSIGPPAGRFRQWLKGIRDGLRWKKIVDWAQKDPLDNEPALPAQIAYDLLNAGSDEEGIALCSEKAAEHLRKRLSDKTSNTPASQIQSASSAGKTTDEQLTENMLLQHDSARILQLLYGEQHGHGDKILWTKIKADLTLLGDLAALLKWSGQLPIPEAELPYTSGDLKVFMLPMNEFSLSGLKNLIFADQERRRQNRFVVGRMASTLAYFQLFEQMTPRHDGEPCSEADQGGNLGFRPEYRRKLIDEPCVLGDEWAHVEECANQVADCCYSTLFRGTSILELLYCERHGLTDKRHELWLTHHTQDEFVSSLAAILLESGQIPEKEINEPYTCDEFKPLLSALENFSVEKLREQVAHDQKKRFKARFEITRLEHTLNFYGLFRFFDDQYHQSVDGFATCTFTRGFADHLVNETIQSAHDPGDEAWIGDLIEGAFAGVSSSKLERQARKIGFTSEEVVTDGDPDLSSTNDLADGQETIEDRPADHPVAFKAMVELLYREQHGFATRLCWKHVLENDVTLSSLAQLLVESRRLPSGDEDLPYGPLELHELMKTIDVFELDRVRTLVLNDLERRRKNRNITEKIVPVLQYYNLYPLFGREDCKTGLASESLSDSLRRYLVDVPPDYQDEAERVKDLAGRIAIRMHLARFKDSLYPKYIPGRAENAAILNTVANLGATARSELFLLLYQRYYQEDIRQYWREKKADPVFLQSLAVLLVHSKLLPDREDFFFYDLADVEFILGVLTEFDITQVNEQLERLNEIWHYAKSYREFLLENDISGPELPGSMILQHVHLPITSADFLVQVQDFLIWEGQEALVHHYYRVSGSSKILDVSAYDDSLRIYYLAEVNPLSMEGTELVYCLSLISLIIFVTEKVTASLKLRERPCRMAAGKDKALLITSSYLEFRKHLRSQYRIGSKDFVYIDYIVRQWANKITENQPKAFGYRTELETIRTALLDGQWPQEVPLLLTDTLENIGRQNQEINQKLDTLLSESSLMRGVLEAAFQKLYISTVERYLDANKQIAFLLAFRVESGTLASLLDILITQDERKLRRIGEQIGVEFFLPDGKRKYNFGQFCPFARIGVVPTNMPFDEFFKEFSDAFSKIIDARDLLLSPAQLSHNLNVLEDVEVIMSRFGLTGQNYFPFRKEGITRDKAIEKIRELLPYELEIKDIVQIIEYQEENILAFMLHLPVKQLVSSQISLSNDEEITLEGNDEHLKQSLLRSQGLRSIDDLAKACLARPTRADAQHQLASLVSATLVNVEWKRCQTIAEAYVVTLAAMAQLL